MFWGKEVKKKSCLKEELEWDDWMICSVKYCSKKYSMKYYGKKYSMKYYGKKYSFQHINPQSLVE